MVESPFHKLQKGSSSSYRLWLLTCGGKPVPQVAKRFKFKLPARLGLLTCGGKPVSQVADTRRKLNPHLYHFFFFTIPILRRHGLPKSSAEIESGQPKHGIGKLRLFTPLSQVGEHASRHSANLPLSLEYQVKANAPWNAHLYAFMQTRGYQ